MATDITVSRAGNQIKEVGQPFDSFFDTLNGTKHTGLDDTKGINTLLDSLGTLEPGDVVTITTNIKFVRTTYYTSLPTDVDGEGTYANNLYTLSQKEENAFQGQTLGVNLKIVATEQ